jgi:hypothetical protein
MIISTQKMIHQQLSSSQRLPAEAEGFTVDDLLQAEKEVKTPSSVSPISLESDHKESLANKILDKLVRRKLVESSWQGPLPRPRISPPRTIGDVLDKAMCNFRLKNSGRRSSPASLSPARSGGLVVLRLEDDRRR